MKELTATNFIIICLAAWRISSLVANEDGPYYIFKRIRSYIESMKSNRSKNWNFDEGIKCEWCNSVWFAFPLVTLIYVLGEPFFMLFVVPLAVSAGVIQIKYIREAIERSNKVRMIARKNGAKNEQQAETNYN